MNSALRCMLMGLAVATFGGAAVAAPAETESAEKQLGHITFETTAAPEAQEAFLRGVLHLHSFGFEEAAGEFRRAQELDPDFALAYWGEALSYNHPLFAEVRDIEAPRAALNRLAPTPEERAAKADSERDRGLLRAVEILFGEGETKERTLAYAEAMGELAERFPDDQEAQAFYSVALLSTVPHVGDSWGDPATYRTRMKAGAIAQRIFADNPEHPGAAHYIIHAFDDPVHAPLGLPAANKFAKIAPTEAHPLHMPSHIYIQLGMWEDVVRSNEASYEAAHRDWLRRDELSPTARYFAEGYTWHALDWGQYGALQLGDWEKSRRNIELMKPVQEETRVPRFTKGRHREGLAEMIARHTVESEQWEVLPITPETTSHELLAIGLSARALDDAETLEAAREELDAIYEKATAPESKMPESDKRHLEIMSKELEALEHLSEGESEKAVELLREASAIADELGLPNGAAQPIKPPHELLGEVLLELDRAEEAAEAFEASLARTPNRRLSARGLAEAKSES